MAIVGGTIAKNLIDGKGCCEGIDNGLVKKIIYSWILTIPLCGIASGIIYYIARIYIIGPY